MAALRTSKSYAADKDSLIGRLNKMEGQVRGIRRMVEEDRYRVDVLQQIASLPALPGVAGPAVGQSTTAFAVLPDSARPSTSLNISFWVTSIRLHHSGG